ncbi:hypothetical protein V3C99_018930 [Haemonchus contortus]
MSDDDVRIEIIEPWKPAGEEKTVTNGNILRTDFIIINLVILL